MSVGAVEALKDKAGPLPLELHTAVRAPGLQGQRAQLRRAGQLAPTERRGQEVKYELAATAAEA